MTTNSKVYEILYLVDQLQCVAKMLERQATYGAKHDSKQCYVTNNGEIKQKTDILHSGKSLN